MRHLRGIYRNVRRLAPVVFASSDRRGLSVRLVGAGTWADDFKAVRPSGALAQSTTERNAR
jgi:hypothetical protein